MNAVLDPSATERMLDAIEAAMRQRFPGTGVGETVRLSGGGRWSCSRCRRRERVRCAGGGTAGFGHRLVHCTCPLLGVKRTCRVALHMSTQTQESALAFVGSSWIPTPHRTRLTFRYLDRERRFKGKQWSKRRRRSWRLSTPQSEWWATCRASPARLCPRFPVSISLSSRDYPIRRRRLHT